MEISEQVYFGDSSLYNIFHFNAGNSRRLRLQHVARDL